VVYSEKFLSYDGKKLFGLREHFLHYNKHRIGRAPLVYWGLRDVYAHTRASKVATATVTLLMVQAVRFRGILSDTYQKSHAIDGEDNSFNCKVALSKMNSIPRNLLVIDKCHTEKILENIAFTHPPLPQKADCHAATAADLRMPMSIVKPKIQRLHTSKSGSAKSGIALLRSSHCAPLQAREGKTHTF